MKHRYFLMLGFRGNLLEIILLFVADNKNFNTECYSQYSIMFTIFSAYLKDYLMYLSNYVDYDQSSKYIGIIQITILNIIQTKRIRVKAVQDPRLVQVSDMKYGPSFSGSLKL